MHSLILYIRGATGLYAFYRERDRHGHYDAGQFKMEYRKQWELAAAIYRAERKKEKANDRNN